MPILQVDDKHDKAMWQWIYPLFALCNFSCTSLLSVWGALVVDTRNIIISQPYWTSICFILYARISVNLLLNFVYFRLARGCGFYLYRVELDPHIGYMDSYTNKLRLRCMFCLSAGYKLHHGTRLEYWFLTLDWKIDYYYPTTESSLRCILFSKYIILAFR